MTNLNTCRVCSQTTSIKDAFCPRCGVKLGFSSQNGLTKGEWFYFLMAGYGAPDVAIPLDVFQRLENAESDEGLHGFRLSVPEPLVGLGLIKPTHLGPQMNHWVSQYAMAVDSEGGYLALCLMASSLITFSTAVLSQGVPSRYTPLIPHIRKVAGCAQNAGLSYAGGLWNELGRYQFLNGEYVDARISCEKAVSLMEAHDAPDDINFAASLNNLGHACERLGYLEQARRCYERALSVLMRRLSLNHLEVAKTLNNLGNYLLNRGDLVGAQKRFEQSMRLNKMAGKLGTAGLVKDLNDLGLVHYNRGDLPAAYQNISEALKIIEDEYGIDHPLVAVMVNNLGLVCYAEKDLARARAFFERALNCDQARLGDQHPDVANRLINLAWVRENMGETQTAIDYCQRALKILEFALPPSHPELLWLKGHLDRLRGNFTS